MDYSNMHFTEEDKKKLVENRIQICSWIMENIVSQLDPEEKINIDYGGIYQSARSWNKVSNYHFAVYGSKHSFYTGGGSQSVGYIGIGQKFGYIEEAFEKTNHAWNIYPVVDNWSEIKSTLLSTLNNMKSAKRNIHEFQV